MARLILSDCFGVVLDEIAPYWFQDHFSSPEKAKELKDAYFVPFDLGEISFDEVMEKMGEELHFDPKDLKEFWNSHVEIDHALLDYYDSLRKKGDVIALASNAGYPFLDNILDKHDLRKHFDKVFISCHFHVAKPDLAFYRLCLKEFQEPFSEVFMVDDSKKNLIEVPKLGIKPILYRDLKELKAILGD